MAKQEDKVEVNGIIEECLPNAEFIVRVEDEKYPNQELKVRGYLSGKMRMNFIKILPGDRVSLELSPYNLGRGRIVYRHK